VDEIAQLVTSMRAFFAQIPKAKTAKLVRHLIDCAGRVPGPQSLAVQAQLCEDSIAWCKAEKRSFLRMRLELRLASLQLAMGRFQPALASVTALLGELKKLDDKQLLVEVHLLEAKIHYALKNVPKARAALTASRTAATVLYVGPELQADVDITAGTLHAEERDYRTAYSYFYEAFEGLSSLGSSGGAASSSDTPSPLLPLRYMLLSKVMQGGTDEANAIINGKAAVKHAGRELEAIRSVAMAYKQRSLHAFERALADFRTELLGDDLIQRHLGFLADQLLEQNLVRVIEPYSCVEIAHVADLIGLPVDRVERKLGGMILDRKFYGTLDQGNNRLLVFEEPNTDKAYAAAIKTVQHLHEAVDTLQKQASMAQARV
jgi:26S proteasome regulatory subunit N6